MLGTIDKLRPTRSARFATLALAAAALIACWAAAPAGAAPLSTQLVYAPGQIVPSPAAIPHEEGDMVDRRIVPDLRWIAKRFPILVTDGYSGPLPDGEHVGCNNCHVRNSDHYNGLAVDLVPLDGTPGKCDASWAPITRLAHWAEPVQNKPRPPFRWVGYEGDAGHGCGNHLHLSWEHAAAPMFQLAEWVEVFPAAGQEVVKQPPPGNPPAGVKPPKGPQGGSEAEPPEETGPRGGISVVQSGGVSARGD
ncbi:MAG TPA: hypothetical protein VF085_07035 [Solirubrobacterales bacterium]